MRAWPALVALLALACSPAPPERQDPALVVLVSLDTLRADRVSAYGYERNTTPHLDALAAEGVLFERVLAQATNTLVSHKSMLTGKQPLRLVHEQSGATAELLRSLKKPHEFLVGTLSVTPTTLAPMFQSDGYRTAAFTGAVWMTEEFRFQDGFDAFHAEKDAGLAGHVPAALDWLDGPGADKRFLFLHSYDIHCPYTPPEPFESLFCPDHSIHVSLENQCPKASLEEQALTARDRVAISDHYDGGVVYADDRMGAFFDGLRERGLWDEALIVVTSDHGESLGAHGQLGHGGLYPEQLFVPLIAKFPASWRVAPRRVADAVELTDLLPTLCEIVRQPIPEGVDGRSLLGAIDGERAHRRVVAQLSFNEFVPETGWITNVAKRAAYDPDGWFLVMDGIAGTRELLRVEDLRTAETLTDPELEASLSATVLEREVFDAQGTFRMPMEHAHSPQALKELRELGYL
ncbi:MAG: sulfatase [Planctomycetota bacterium]